MGVAPSFSLSGNSGLRGIPPGEAYEQELKPAFGRVTLGMSQGKDEAEARLKVEKMKPTSREKQEEWGCWPASWAKWPRPPAILLSKSHFSDSEMSFVAGRTVRCSEGKVLAARPNELSSIPSTHIVERETTLQSCSVTSTGTP